MLNKKKHLYHDGASQTCQVFVFGSNLMGQHVGGAAKFAADHRGAMEGTAHGLVELWCPGEAHDLMSYALPTMATLGVPLTLTGVAASVTLFKAYATIRPELEFFVTAIGTGIAGFTHEEIAPLFADCPDNCYLPGEWQAILE